MTELIRRAEWGARHPDGFKDRPLPVKEWWLHHSVTIAPDLVPPFDDDDAAVRTLERIGQERFGGGISYTYAITPVGRIYQGHSLGRVGAHTKGHNTVGAAFVLVGDYSRREPTAAQRTAIAQRMVQNHRDGYATTHHLTGGHRDVSSTSCPGAKAYAAIQQINAEADRLWSAGYPATAPPTTTPGGTMTNNRNLTDADVERIRDAILWAPTFPGQDGLGGSSVRNNIGLGAAYAKHLVAEVAGLKAAVAVIASRGTYLTPAQLTQAIAAGIVTGLGEADDLAGVDEQGDEPEPLATGDQDEPEGDGLTDEERDELLRQDEADAIAAGENPA